MKETESKNVLVALKMSGISGREKLSGVYRYLKERYGDSSVWNLRLIRTSGELSARTMAAAIKAGTDGYILSIPGIERSMAPLVKNATPAIVMDIPSSELEKRRRNLVTIHNSSRSIGELAADILASGGYRTIAFLPTEKPADWSNSRHREFASALAERGRWCHELKRLDEIVDLPRPAAVFAAYDDRAIEAMNFIKNRGVSIPEEISILGVDNDTMLCEHSSPRLTSIKPDFELEGYLAARELDAMMSAAGRGCATRRISVPAQCVVTRDSLKIDSAAGRLVRKAIDYIERHATEGIGVQDVVRHLGCSRRLADLRFHEVRGISILTEITDRRLDAVKSRLTLTRAKIETISAECGFPDANYLKSLFKKKFGCTMREWRSLH